MGVAVGLVEYYFPSLDDLSSPCCASPPIASSNIRRGDPIRLTFARNLVLRQRPCRPGSLMEFLALANHRIAVRSVLGEGGERVRQALVASVSADWSEKGLDDEDLP